MVDVSTLDSLWAERYLTRNVFNVHAYVELCVRHFVLKNKEPLCKVEQYYQTMEHVADNNPSCLRNISTPLSQRYPTHFYIWNRIHFTTFKETNGNKYNTIHVLKYKNVNFLLNETNYGRHSENKSWKPVT